MSFVHLIIHFTISYFLYLVTFQLFEEREDFFDTISKTNYYHTFFFNPVLFNLFACTFITHLLGCVTQWYHLSCAARAETKQKKKSFGSELLSAVFITNELESNVGQRVIWVSFYCWLGIISGPGNFGCVCVTVFLSHNNKQKSQQPYSQHN